jgi:urease accessory protein
MSSTATLHAQRSCGRIDLAFERDGLRQLSEAGAAKVRCPRGGGEAILINTGGGLAGGDEFEFNICVGTGASLTATTQAAERVYRTLGPTARLHMVMKAGPRASLLWLPQETILFQGAALSRRLEVDLAPDARLLAIESVVFGRKAMGEQAKNIWLRDRWRIRKNSQLVFADDIAIDGTLPSTPATLDGAGAMATIALIADDADRYLPKLRAALNGNGAASAWNGKLVARVLASDGFDLRKTLFPALRLLAAPAGLPKVWSL